MSTPAQQLGTFAKQQLRFTFTLSNNATFAGTGSNRLIVTGLRALCTVKGSGLPAFPEADLEVYGMLQQDMIALTALAWTPNGLQKNSVLIEALTPTGWSTVFAGQIITGGPDYSNIPNVPYRAQCRILGFESLNPAAPTSYTGTTLVSTVVSNIAAKIGYAFVNSGVTSTLDSPYFDKTLPEQLRKVKADTGIQIYIENNTIVIAPAGQPINVPTFALSPQTGLVGFPKLDFQRGFVNVQSFYNAGFRFGGPITVSGSQVPTANGSWMIGTIAHRLSSDMSDGPWFSDLLLYPPGILPPTP